MSENLLSKLYQSTTISDLQEICPSIYTSNVLGTPDIDISYSIDFNGDSILEYQQQYFNKVEEGNNYIKELQEIEKLYFTKKYGENIYKYIIDKRNKYIQDEVLCTSSSSSNIVQDISYEYNIYNTFNNGVLDKQINLLNDNNDMITKNVNKMQNENELNSRKIEYRKSMSNNVLNLNRIITTLYYFILLCIFIYLFIDDKLMIHKRKFLYIILILFPILYKYVYKFILFLYAKITNNFDVHGPKNAFLDETPPLRFLDDTISSS